MGCPALPELSRVAWGRSVTHLAPCAHPCPVKGGNGNAEAPLCWVLFLISTLGKLRAHGFHSLISRFCWQLWNWQSLLCFLAGLVLEWLTAKNEHFWGQTCESTVLKVEFERHSGSHHFICPRAVNPDPNTHSHSPAGKENNALFHFSCTRTSLDRRSLKKRNLKAFLSHDAVWLQCRGSRNRIAPQ